MNGRLGAKRGKKRGNFKNRVHILFHTIKGPISSNGKNNFPINRKD
jgi:hypothetical protein